MRLRSAKRIALATAAALALAASISATSGASTSSRTDDSTPVNGGTLLAGIPDNVDHLDPGLSYTNEGWEIFEATNDGLLTFARTDDQAKSSTIVPDIAAAMPTVSKDGLTYTFKVRKGVRFSPPVNRDGAALRLQVHDRAPVPHQLGRRRASTPASPARTPTRRAEGRHLGHRRERQDRDHRFHLTKRDGTFLDYMSIPFAFAVPKGTPDKDVSTIDKWRIATGPYMISKYVPKQSVTIVRNPNFKQWTPNTPGGHLDGINIKIGITPDAAVNMTADDQLDWYFEPIASDRYTQLKAQYPDQVHPFVRNNVTYFVMNSKKPPFDKLAVRQAVNYAVDRTALVKIFGGQGTPTENILPPGLGSAYKAAPPVPARSRQGEGAREVFRRRGHGGDRLEPHDRPDAEGRAVHGERAQLARLQDEREDVSTSRSTGTRSRPRRAIRRSRSRTGTRTSLRGRTSSTCC